MIKTRFHLGLSLMISVLGAGAAGAGVQRFIPSVPGTNLQFGYSVGADQGVALVGIPYSGTPFLSGTVETFERDGLGVWASAGLYQAAVPIDHSGFGTGILFQDGQAFVGAQGEGDQTGSVHWMVRDPLPPHDWSVPVKIVAPDGAPQAAFSAAMAAQGNRLVVSAPRAIIPDTEISCGAVYVFARSGDTWNLEQRIQAVADCPPLLGSHNFGEAIALDGDRLVASLLPGVIIYERISGVWQEATRIFPGPDANGNNQSFGRHVALEGNRLLVASPGNRRIYIYEKSGGSWSLVDTLAPSDPTLSIDYGGDAIALQGDLALVGCTGCPLGQPNASGLLYLYERQPSGTWLLVRRFVGPEAISSFGQSIDFDGTQAWIGAFTGNRTGPNSTGAAYVIDVAPAVFSDGFETGDATAWIVDEGP